MERIKVRQQKFKRGKERMLSMAQESGDGQTLEQPEDDDDDGMMKPAGLSHCALLKCLLRSNMMLRKLKQSG